MVRILFTGGGTGGHIYPILAVAEELKKIAENRKIETKFYYIGAPKALAQSLVSNGIIVLKIFSAGLRRYFDVRNFFDFFIFPVSVFQAFWKVFWVMPDILFSKGGTGSLPVVLACWFYRVPIIIHDSDSIMGLANKLAVRFSDRIAFSFYSAAEELVQSMRTEKQKEAIKRKIALIGNPIRSSLNSGLIKDKTEAKNFFGFNENKPLILVLGGSQGAVRINDFFLNVAGELAKDYLVLHQTGIDNFKSFSEELKVALKNFGETEKARYKAVSYFEKDLENAYAAADIVVSRAGSGAIFEFAAFGIPAILVPLSVKVVGAHQIKNAYEYSESGAAAVIEEENLKSNIFLAMLEKILKNQEKLKLMSEAAKKFSKPDAALIIAKEIMEFINLRRLTT